jgi:hypothetical protein
MYLHDRLETALEKGASQAATKSGEVSAPAEVVVAPPTAVPESIGSTPAFQQMALGTAGRMRRGAPTSMSKKRGGRWARKIRRLKKGGGR